MFLLPCCVHFSHLGRLCCNSGVFSWQPDILYMFCIPNKWLVCAPFMTVVWNFSKHGWKVISSGIIFLYKTMLSMVGKRCRPHCLFILSGTTIPPVMCIWWMKRQWGHNTPSHTSKDRGTLLKRAPVSVIMGHADTPVSSLLFPATLLCTLKTAFHL